MIAKFKRSTISSEEAETRSISSVYYVGPIHFLIVSPKSNRYKDSLPRYFLVGHIRGASCGELNEARLLRN